MSLSLVFLHGWGFDAGFWAPVVQRLPGRACIVEDRGYFGGPAPAMAGGPLVVVGHSLGAMRALANPPQGCAGLVAINGFDRFADRGDGTGTSVRVLDRMVARLARDPARVVADFRARCGAGPPGAAPRPQPLRDDLMVLRDGDCRSGAAGFAGPMLVLHGAADPLLPSALRASSFARAALVERHEMPGAGHLLPLSHPDWCAARIAAFVARLA